MSDNTCKYCNKKFSTFSNLTNHQKSAKYCLEIQQKEIQVKFTCDYCQKQFSQNHHLKKHLDSCKEKESLYNQNKNDMIDRLKKDNEKLNKINIKLKQDLIEKDKQLDILNNNERIYKDEINKLNDRIIYKEEMYKEEKTKVQTLLYTEKLYEEEKLKVEKLQNELKSLAEKALEKVNVTQIHNANNIVNNKNKMIQALEPLTLKAIEDQAKYIKVDSVKNHAVSLAEFFYQNVLKGKVILNDASRNIFSYKDEYGKISRDEGGIKISNMIINASRDQIYTCCVEYLKFLDSTPRLLRNDKYYDLYNNIQKIGKICINKNNPNNSEYFESFKKTFMNHLKDLVGFGEEEPKAIIDESSLKVNRDSVPIKDNFLVENRDKFYDLLTRYSEFLDIKAEEQGDYKEDESYLTAVLEGLEHMIRNEKVKDLYNTKQFMINFYRGVSNMKIYKDDIVQKNILSEDEINYISKF